MLERWAIGIVIAFIVRQIGKFGKTIDWTKVKADVDVRVRALVPGEWFDDEAVDLVNSVLDRAALVLTQEAAIEEVLKLAAAGKWSEAVEALKRLILDGWVSASAAVLAALKD